MSPSDHAGLFHSNTASLLGASLRGTSPPWAGLQQHLPGCLGSGCKNRRSGVVPPVTSPKCCTLSAVLSHTVFCPPRWFLQFFDSIFSPIYYSLLGFHVFGLGFVTSMVSAERGRAPSQTAIQDCRDWESRWTL